MPTVSFDGQSFQVDGKRIWLVSGAIHYTRTPRELWRSRIRAAKQAGLNCIETYCFWNVHEPKPGVFHFDGDADLRAFVKLIAEEGMYCILRPGPYICAEWDFGGLPAWLHKVEGIKLREANGPFLEACARYLGEVFEQVKDLQQSSMPAGRTSGSGGPIIMVQAENEWLCHNPVQADSYLREIVRYLRESGCDVPINACNNLWQRVEGTIDTWNANEHLAADLRQLRLIQPTAPRIVTEFWPGWFDGWGREHHTRFDAQWNLYRLAQILASGAQYNLYMFHGGTNFGFYGGRNLGGDSLPGGAYLTASYDYDAPLREAGGRGEKYYAAKRISTFASHFGHVFASLNAEHTHAAFALTDDDHSLSVVHQQGPQGQVVFLFKGRNETRQTVGMLLPNGLTLNVPLGRDRVAWFVVDANLDGTSRLTHTNLRPWALIEKKMLVLFGPAGAEGLISINESPLTVKVPSGHSPLVERHEDWTVVVLNEEQVDAAYPLPTGLVVGAAELNEKNLPLPREGWATMTMISLAGDTKRITPKVEKTAAAPKLGEWSSAPLQHLITGASEDFKPIDGPASLESLGQNFGYGWYRLTRKSAKATSSGLAPHSGDRLHFFTHGKLDGVIGAGPGAEWNPTNIKLDKTTVVLADNLGRYCFGWLLGEKKGLFGDIYEVRPIRLGKPQVVASRTPDLFALGGVFTFARRGEQNPTDTLTWKFKAAKKPLVLDINGLPMRVLVLVNDTPVAGYDNGCCSGRLRHVIAPEVLRNGQNELKLALFSKWESKVNVLDHVTLYDTATNLTDEAEWAFTPWEPPTADDFGKGKKGASGPCWYRTEFRVKSAVTPLWLEPAGLSKGQIFLNGRNLGRYFVATQGGQSVPPQERYYLPEPWLKTDGVNELMIFDEHGRSPSRCRLVYDAMGPYGE